MNLKLFAWKGGATPRCWLQSISPSPAVVAAVGTNATFTAAGSMLGNLQWTGQSSVPSTGTGPMFTAKWNSVGSYTVTASGCGVSQTANVTVVGVKKIIKAGTAENSPAAATVTAGILLNLRALRDPAPSDGPWPSGFPVWQTNLGDNPFAVGSVTTFGSDRSRAQFLGRTLGTWTVTATCGSSSTSFAVEVLPACGQVTGVTSGVCEFTQMQSTTTAPVIELVGPKSEVAGAKLRLTATLVAGADSSKVTWQGATANPANRLQADVPIDQSVRQDVTVMYDGNACRSVRVWPVQGHRQVPLDWGA